MTTDQYLGINIDYSRDSKFDELGIKRLKESYMREDETSPQQRYAFASKTFSSNPEHAQRLYDYASNHWLSYSTPILSHGRSSRGLGISCYLSYLEDSSSGLVDTLSEVNWLSMLGGGVGVHVKIRSADEKSVGIMPHLKIYDASSLAYRQGSTRRGSYATYLDISHPDIIQFLEIRKPTGDPNIRCMNLHHGINVSDKFMELIEQCMVDPNTDDTWNLYDPYNPERVVDTISAKELWQRILEMRMHTGEPYLFFGDTANKHLPEWQKQLGLTINGSNLCSEIFLATDKDRTAVCCLSSLNLEYYDQWKNNYQFYKDVLEMLDNVLQYFIEHAPDTISRAKFSALRERSVGVGTLGFHSYLQQKMIPFESALSKSTNNRIFKNIRKNLDKANLELGAERGEALDIERSITITDTDGEQYEVMSSSRTNIIEDGEKKNVRYFQLKKGDVVSRCKSNKTYTVESITKGHSGHGKRNSHVMAIAPNASTSIILGNTSPSIEPLRANAYRQDTLSGSFLNKNKYLDKILKERCDEKEYDKAWKHIISHDGSVQQLTVLSQEEKDVFKTAMEIDQRWVIELAADRQEYIDQGQSVNLFFAPNANILYLHAVHFSAWKQGLKSLYYCRSDSIRKADKVSQQIERKIIEEIDLMKVVEGEECLACQ